MCCMCCSNSKSRCDCKGNGKDKCCSSSKSRCDRKCNGKDKSEMRGFFASLRMTCVFCE